MKIQTTKNYRLLQLHHAENRPLEIDNHKKLLKSMRKYGFLKEFPVVVLRDPTTGTLVIKEGQHRVYFAEFLGLPVHYVEATTDFDIAEINSTAKVWRIIDYARKHAANGLKEYQEAMDFAERHGLPIGKAISLLSGTVTFNNIEAQFFDGEFKVKDRDWAESVATLYGRLVEKYPEVKNSRCLEACMAVCRVENFDQKRLVMNAKRCPEKFLNYSTKDAYLEMLEDVYNFGKKHLVGLKAEAVMAMRNRNAVEKAVRNKQGAGQ